MNPDSVFQVSLYISLGTAIATFTAAATALGLLTPKSIRGRLISVVVLLSSVLGITGAFITVANQEATLEAHLAIASGLVATAFYVVMRALMSVFRDRRDTDMDLDGVTMSPPALTAASGEPRSRYHRRGLVISTALIVLSSGALMAVVTPDLFDDFVNPSQRVVVSNLSTNGADGMSEKTSAVVAGSRPVGVCRFTPGCKVIPGSPRTTGGTYEAECQIRGERVTNGTNFENDDANPGLFESTRYYGVRLPTGFGYVNEVWMRSADRGGLGLPECSPTT